MCQFLHNIMHHLAYHSFNSEPHKFFFFQKVTPISKVARCPQPTRVHGTRANIRKKMDFLEQENQALKEEMAAMQAKIDEMAAMQSQVDELSELVKTLKAAQNQPPPPPPPVRTRAEARGTAIPDWTIYYESPIVSAPPRSAPWFPPFTSGEILRPIACEPPMPTFQHTTHVPPPVATRPPATLTYSAPVVHTVPQNEEPIFHSGNIEVCNKVDDLQDRKSVV